MGQEEEVEWGPVMPFNVVESKGGPYQDESFVAGYSAGLIDAKLAAGPPFLEQQPVKPELVPQLDLLAMRYGYKMETADSLSPDWVFAKFTRTDGGMADTQG